MKIQVRINEEGALRNQRYAFTDRFTLISELLQNARRAGAFHINVEYDAADRKLSVRDDGRGLDDFQKLLSFHESGWDNDIADREHPFGIGFTKCLYAATHITVASGRQRVAINTAAALRREPFEVETVSDPIEGTYIELHGAEIEGLERRLETLCQGFPVDVVFNSRPLERRYAEHRLAETQTPIGSVHVAGNRDGKATHSTLVFLQGFCVKRPVYFDPSRVNVIHLDPREFMARLPDRDILIDSDQQLERVDKQLKQCWRQILEVAIKQLPPRQFVETYFDAMHSWGHLDLLNVIDELPVQLFGRISGYPIRSEFCDRDYLKALTVAPTRQAIEQGDVTLVSMDWLSEENTAHWMYVREKAWLVFKAHILDAAHWVHPFIRRLEEQLVEVEAMEVLTHVPLEGRWVQPEVTLCRAVHIRIGDDEVAITDAGVCHEGDILVPAGECSGEPVRQLSKFIDENDRFLKADMEADRDALADLIRRLRSTDPAATLDSLLTEIRLGKYPQLQGKRFEIAVGVGMAPGHSVELLKFEGTPSQPDGGNHA